MSTDKAMVTEEREDLIAEAITEAFGERCEDFEPDCYCCKAWAEYDRLSAALAQAGQPVAVKPLLWRGPDCGFYEADTIGGVVRIMDGLRDEPGRFILNPASGKRTKFDTLEAAQTAAQADYERRILSALAHPPAKREAGETAPAPVQHVRCRDCDGYNCDDGCAYPDPAPRPESERVSDTPSAALEASHE